MIKNEKNGMLFFFMGREVSQSDPKHTINVQIVAEAVIDI